ncbi:unnamed protein product [Dracunculus medinensis]|uniref:Abnormal cell migration protein 18-like fibronectin type I domain-containing protein n=1 Tax=Dracunculus medinensis TaxID=318479 RepID=A0A158Q4R4_DRAME|nr:unnamed protein product [Dracunculus medinensis]
MFMKILTFFAIFIGKCDQRSMILTNWFGNGVRNVRYMTVANNFIDTKGNYVANKSNPRQERSKTIYDCVDIMGTIRKHGEQYERPNGRFKYRCNNGECRPINWSITTWLVLIMLFWARSRQRNIHKIWISACIGSERNGKALIKIGNTLDKDGFWYKCAYFPENQTGIYTEGKLLEAICAVCIKNNHVFKEGERYAANHLHYECKAGTPLITGCYTNENRKMQVGEDIIEKNMVYRCYRLNSLIHYEEYACGFRGTPSCKPEPIQSEPNNLINFNRSFNSFSIAQLTQRTGEDKIVAGSSSISLVPVISAIG